MCNSDLSQYARMIAQENSLKLGSFVGGGAFKQTFLCQSGATTHYALKIFDPSKSTNERNVREIEALRRCESLYIARVLDAGVYEGGDRPITFLLEEYLDGGPLSDTLAHERLSEYGALELAKQVTMGIAHMWALRLVHRDLKPENIMYRSASSEPVIVDLGLVRDLSSASLTATWLSQGPGTPAYAAPEQLNNDKGMIDWRADQFSLGVVLSVSLTGSHPFAANVGEDIVQSIPRVAARYSANEEILSGLSSHMREIIRRMIRPWPVQRYTDPRALIGDIDSAWSSLT